MATENESSAWGVIVGAILIALCCAGPLIAAVAGPALVIAAAWLEPYRPYLLTGAGLLFVLGIYSLRRGRAPRCCDPGGPSSSRPVSRRIAVLLWAGAALALVGALLAGLGRAA